MTAQASSYWPVFPISQVAKIIMGQSPPGETYNTSGEGLPFYQGKADFGEVAPTPSKWCTSANVVGHAGDILLSVRAPVGPTNLANEDCGIGRGLAIIRPIQNIIDAHFLLYFFRTIEEQLAERGQGSTFQAINRGDIEKLKIPLPTLPEQQRIMDIMRQAEELRDIRRLADEQIEDLHTSLFFEMFGNPITNEKGWKKEKVGKKCNLVRGSSPRPQGDLRYFGGPVPRLMVADLTRDGIYVTPKIDSLTEEGATYSRPMKAGSVVMAVSGAPGLPAIINITPVFMMVS
jgi:type I restriction enzyme, S subunit